MGAGTFLAVVAGICHAEDNDEAKNPVITGIHVEVIGFPDPESVVRDFIRDLILLEEGIRFSETLLDRSIRALRRTRRFDSIEVDSSERDGKFELHFKLSLRTYFFVT